jgi:hypothetical protein
MLKESINIKFYIMKKSILNLVGAQELTRKDQKSINGGMANKCIGNDVSACGIPPVGYYYICSGRYCLLVDLP